MNYTKKISRFLIGTLNVPKECINDQLISLFSFETFKKSQSVFDLETDDNNLYFIYSGSAIAWRHKANSDRIVIERVFYEVGDILISDCLFENTTKTMMHISALKDLQLIGIDRDTAFELSKQLDQVGHALLLFFEKDLIHSNRWYFNLTTIRELPAKERLEAFMKDPYYKPVIEKIQKKMIPSLLDMNSRTYERVKEKK